MAVAAVREAEAGDASAMAAVQLDVWRTPYADFVPAEVLSAVDYESATRAWKLAIISAGPAYVLVATEGSEVVGFAAGAGSEVSALVVAPRWTRRGHGGRLLGTLAERLRSGGRSGWPRATRRPGRSFLATVGHRMERCGRRIMARGCCASCGTPGRCGRAGSRRTWPRPGRTGFGCAGVRRSSG